MTKIEKGGDICEWVLKQRREDESQNEASASNISSATLPKKYQWLPEVYGSRRSIVFFRKEITINDSGFPRLQSSSEDFHFHDDRSLPVKGHRVKTKTNGFQASARRNKLFAGPGDVSGL